MFKLLSLFFRRTSVSCLMTTHKMLPPQYSNHGSVKRVKRFMWRNMRSCWTVRMHAKFLQISLQ